MRQQLILTFGLIAALSFLPSWVVGFGAFVALLFLLIYRPRAKRQREQINKALEPKNVVLLSAYRRGRKSVL